MSSQNPRLRRRNAEALSAARLAPVAAQATLRSAHSAPRFRDHTECDHARGRLRGGGGQGAERADAQLHRCVRPAVGHTVQEVEAIVQHRFAGHLADAGVRHCRAGRCADSDLGSGDGQLQVHAQRTCGAGDAVEVGSDRAGAVVGGWGGTGFVGARVGFEHW